MFAFSFLQREVDMRGTISSGERFLAVVLVGMMAGLMFGTGMDQYTHRLLDARAWVTEHQVMDVLFRRVLPPLWNVTMISLAVAAVLSHGNARWLFALAAGIFLVSLIVTVTVEVPMNRVIALWNPQAAPTNWEHIRDRWLSFHRLSQRTRCTCKSIAFSICILLVGPARWSRAEIGPPAF